MKFEFNLNWTWILQKVRLFFLLGVFYVLYVYTQPVFAFMWGMYFILNDLLETVTELENLKEEQRSLWKSILNKQRGF